jgi:mRNA interferase HigB
MHIISRKKLLPFSQKYPDSFTPLDNWYRIAKAAKWLHLEQVKQSFPKAEAVGNCTVFNIKGNSYRLIVSIDYEAQIIYVKYVLTHVEYDKDDWKRNPFY